MPKPPQPSASEVLRHNLLILVGLPSLILLPFGTSIVLPVGYMDQPTGLLHIIIPLEEVMWQVVEEVN